MARATREALEKLIAPTVAAMGYSLVRVRLFEGGQLRLQVMAEREANGTMTVDDCATLSRALSAVLDVEDPIGGSYDLEISSPGIDRPLVGPDDYERFNGFEAKLETALLIDGRRRFRGRLRGFDGDTVRIALRDGSEANVPLTAIRDAKLMLTDDLVKASLNAAETTDE
ncbi:MAG: ribosome maturation factor RimP [Alphaproteobacteria bacterium]|nr:ribosome maturation factor RimP [Alphaproteobacteria bacterium]MDP7173060.1 ribosome maturation factor RimP [Alphaproteobacteria bacterium]MDP7233105.1 ribosome maturation factor RimP [Alphaproteobacteria bacterium]MDP7487518.1 ribosome maturation factor RimP [Alphaproteobacteria bacterium]MEE1543156.1 ribosome maturation factor RimP [Alphaproteobacteria bacterium]